MKFKCIFRICILSFVLCFNAIAQKTKNNVPFLEVFPDYISDTVLFDTDDPAIYYNKKRPNKSFVIGTDKGGKTGNGGIFVFDLKGKNIKEKKILGINRPNNIYIAYGIGFKKNRKIDIAVCTERNTNKIRIIQLPEMVLIDNGGIEVFEGETDRSPMGISLYTNPLTHEISAIVGRKSGPSANYLFQYALQSDKDGIISGKLLRKFGQYSGKKEIESIAVDNELGYVYYSDETFGIRKYYANPDSSGLELALFGKEGFTDDHEGISIYKTSNQTGFILVSDQQANQFQVFKREGDQSNPNKHDLLKLIKTQTGESDGSEITQHKLNKNFKNGLFVAMSNNKTFHFYSTSNFFLDLNSKVKK